MSRTLLLTGVGTLLSLLSACRTGPLDTRTLSRTVDVSDGTVLIRGRWKAMTRTEVRNPPFSPQNAVEVECSKERRVCTESLAVISGEMGRWPNLGDNVYLHVANFQYQIVEWSDSSILATSATRAADLRIQISLRDSAAERTQIETSARGAQGADPRPYVWTLE